MKPSVIAIVSLAAAVGGCWLLPDRYAFNAPVSQMIFGTSADPPPASALGSRIRPPPGTQVDFYATGVEQARFLRFTRTGDLLVSQPRLGRLSLLSRDADGDGRADETRVLLDELRGAQGLDFHDDWLYLAERDGIARIRFDHEAGATEGPLERIVSGIPEGGNHWTRTLRVGPDERLYVTVGSSCNVCEEDDPRRAAMLRYALDGSGEEILATGLRNAAGFDWRPGTDELYATDNGRDLLGDDFPPCELNRIVAGGFYGWPYANGANVPDPNLGSGGEDVARAIESAIPPVHGFRAHNAPLGITFAVHDGVVDRGTALVALHGSWNRTRKDGYKVVSLHWDATGAVEERDFLVGFEQDEDVVGRPVDVAVGPDGSVFVSDDYAGAIYRVHVPTPR